MKKEESFLDFLIKNRFIIITLVIAFFLISSGILSIFVSFSIVVLVLFLAIFLGKVLH